MNRDLRPHLLIVVALTLVAAAACERAEEPAEVPARAARPAPEPEVSVELLERSRPLMSTLFIIKVGGVPESTGEAAIGRAFAEIERLERVLSEWLPDSEISRINSQAGGEPVVVGPDTLRVVKAGVDVSRWSDGAFDLSWAALRGLYDFRPESRRVPTRAEVRPRLGLIRWQDILIDEEASTVQLRREGMAIGTGSIAKGYALDRAGEILREAGIESYMLFGGGQVQVHGMRGDRPWRVGIQHPRQGADYFAFLEVTDGSISTSGDYEHYFRDQRGRRWHHILDLGTGMPVRHTMSVTLLSRSGIYADALSTAAFVLGPERAIEMLGRIEEEAEAVILDQRCKMHLTPDTRARLRFSMELTNDTLPGCSD